MITIQLLDVAPVEDGTETSPHPRKVGHAAEGSIGIDNATCVIITEKSPFSSDLKGDCFKHEGTNGQVRTKSNCLTSELPRVSQYFREEEGGCKP